MAHFDGLIPHPPATSCNPRIYPLKSPMTAHSSGRLKQIEALVHTANWGGLSAAARAEGVTPAMIDRRLEALEVRLGEMRRLVVASPDYLAAHGVPHTPAQLQQHNCL